MSISDPEDMSNDTSHSYTSRIVQSHGKPSHRFAMLLGKVMSHDRLELLHEFGISFRKLGGCVIFHLNFLETFSKMVWRVVDVCPVPAMSKVHLGRSSYMTDLI